jgi:hypothetical protein
MKLLIKISFILLLAISAITLHCCKPDDEVGKTYGPYTLGEARDYIDFKPGSWWVYQNNKSGLYDTLVLKSISIRSQTFTGKNTVIKDMVNMLIYSTTTKYEYEYYTFGANPDLPAKSLAPPYSIDLRLGKSKAGDYNGETVTFFYPFDKNHKGNISMFESSLIHKDTTIVLPKYTIDSVVVFKCKDDACWDGFTVNYYWAKDVGLIRKENINKGESWDLVNYHIEKQ